MKKRLPLTVLALLFCSFIWSQTGYYETYDDFVARRIIKMEKISLVSSGGGITLKNGNKRVTMKADKVWGFVVDGQIFRGIEGKDLFAAVIFASDNAIIYGNGFSYAIMAMRQVNEFHYINGYAYYISLNINSPIVPIFNVDEPCTKMFIQFRDENPQLNAFYECLPADKKNYTEANFKPCIETLR